MEGRGLFRKTVAWITLLAFFLTSCGRVTETLRPVATSNSRAAKPPVSPIADRLAPKAGAAVRSPGVRRPVANDRPSQQPGRVPSAMPGDSGTSSVEFADENGNPIPDPSSGSNLHSGGLRTLPVGTSYSHAYLKQHAQYLEATMILQAEFANRGYIRRASADTVVSTDSCTIVYLGYEKPGVSIGTEQPIIVINTFPDEVSVNGGAPIHTFGTTVVGGMVIDSSGYFAVKEGGPDAPVGIVADYPAGVSIKSEPLPTGGLSYPQPLHKQFEEWGTNIRAAWNGMPCHYRRAIVIGAITGAVGAAGALIGAAAAGAIMAGTGVGTMAAARVAGTLVGAAIGGGVGAALGEMTRPCN